MSDSQAAMTMQSSAQINARTWAEPLVGLFAGAMGGALSAALHAIPFSRGIVLRRLFRIVFRSVFRKTRHQRRRWADLGIGVRTAHVADFPRWNFAFVFTRRRFAVHAGRCSRPISATRRLPDLFRHARRRFIGNLGRASSQSGAIKIQLGPRDCCRWTRRHRWRIDLQPLGGLRRLFSFARRLRRAARRRASPLSFCILVWRCSSA